MKRRIAFLFAGQGAQTPGMCRDLAEAYPAARAVFETADRSLGRSISAVTFGSDADELNRTHNTQPCMLAADLAACEALRSCGIGPDAAAGFSLGEYAALVAAGVLSAEDAFPLVQVRADAMQEAVPEGEGGMVAVIDLRAPEIEALCRETGGYLIAANYNSPLQTVVSGERAAVDRLLTIGEERGIRMVRLAVSAPFHCEMMAPVSKLLAERFRTVAFRTPRFPVYLNIDAAAENDPDAIRSKLALQAKSPVRWQTTIERMKADGIDTFIQLGPGTLVKTVWRTVEGAATFTVADLASLRETREALGRD